MNALHPAILFDAEFPATAADVRAQLVRVEAAFGADRCDADAASDMLIVLGEVLNNVVEHAGVVGDGRVRVCVRHCGDRLAVEASDDGRPLPPSLLGAAPAPALDGAVDDLPEGGFGWFIIHSLVEDMTYERQDGRNRLSFSLAA